MRAPLSLLNREREQNIELAERLAAQLREVRAAIKELDEAILVLSGHKPEPAMKSVGPNLESLILAQLATVSPGGSSPKQIADLITAAGRPTGETSVSSALSRMKTAGKTTNDRGQWFLLEPALAPELPATLVADLRVDDPDAIIG